MTWMGGPLNGFFLASSGETTEVASVKRAIFGVLIERLEEDVDEDEEVRAALVII